MKFDRRQLVIGRAGLPAGTASARVRAGQAGDADLGSGTTVQNASAPQTMFIDAPGSLQRRFEPAVVYRAACGKQRIPAAPDAP